MTEKRKMERDLLIAAEALIPHGLGMRLITGVKQPTEKGLEAETTVSERWPLSRDGRVSSLLGIELVAQAVAALSTYRRGEGARPRIGLLVGIKEAKFSCSDIPLRTRVTVRIEELYHIGAYAVFRGEVSAGKELICSTILQVAEPEEKTTPDFIGTQSILLAYQDQNGGE